MYLTASIEDKSKFPNINSTTQAPIINHKNHPVHRALPSEELVRKFSVMGLLVDQSAAWRKTLVNVS